MTDKTAARSRLSDFEPVRIARGRGNGRVLQRTRNTPRKRALLEVLEGTEGFSAPLSFMAVSTITWLIRIYEWASPLSTVSFGGWPSSARSTPFMLTTARVLLASQT